MPNRGSAGTYRYGFNGQELDQELDGDYSAQYWEYDPRLGRRWNIDPVIKVWESPYACFANNPVWFSDPLGDDSAQRAKALEYAYKFVQSNPHKSAKLYGFAGYHAGKPGEAIDCSGLVSQCSNYSGFGYLNQKNTKKKYTETGVSISFHGKLIQNSTNIRFYEKGNKWLFVGCAYEPNKRHAVPVKLR